MNDDTIDRLERLLHDEGTDGALFALATACRRLAARRDGEGGDLLLRSIADDLDAIRNGPVRKTR